MIERVVVFALAAGTLVLAYEGLRRWQFRRASSFAPGDPLLARLRPGVPAILYFTTPTCVPCKTQQRPALQKLLAELGEQVQVVEVNAQDDLAAARRWGVMTVPTTFILDGQGRPREINNGVAGTDKLKRQLQGL